jgi:hypothetical protein
LVTPKEPSSSACATVPDIVEKTMHSGNMMFFMVRYDKDVNDIRLSSRQGPASVIMPKAGTLIIQQNFITTGYSNDETV